MSASRAHLFPKGPILIVEDDFFIGQELLHAFRACGAQIAGVAPDVASAMRLIETQRVTGAVLDIKLGGETVYSFARELKRRAIPFVFLSGYSRDAIPSEFEGAPLVEKPFCAQEVAKALVTGQEIVRTQAPFANRILARFPLEMLNELRRNSSVVPLRCRAVLQRAGARTDHVWFIESGLSVLSVRAGGVATGLIGLEGAVGLDASLVTDTAALESMNCVVEAPGSAVRVSVQTLRNLMMDWPAARDPAVTFLNNLHAQTATSLECASTMSIHTRVSRWILMASERIGPEIPITQDALSHHLGVRRAGVTEALQEIEAANAIERRRGRIVVRDRAALEGRAAHRKQINGAHGRLPTSTLLA